MKKQEAPIPGSHLSVGFLTVCILWGLAGCKKDATVNTPESVDFIITQSDLDDAAVFIRDSNITGDTTHNLFASIHVSDTSVQGWHYMHDTMTILHSMRTIYENQTAHLDSAKVG